MDIVVIIIKLIATITVTTAVVYSFIEKKGFKGALIVTSISVFINLIINKSLTVGGLIVGAIVALIESLIYMAIFKRSKSLKNFVIKCILIYLIVTIVTIVIIVGISIYMTVNDPLLELAEQTNKKIENAYNYENEIVNNYDYNNESTNNNNNNYDDDDETENNYDEEELVQENEIDINSIVLPEGYEDVELLVVLYNQIVVAKRENKLAFYDAKQEEFTTDFIYDGVGYKTQETDVNGEKSVVIVPKETGLEGIVVKMDGLYGIYDINVNSEVIPCLCTRIYSIDEGENIKFYMEFNGNQLEMKEYFNAHNMVTAR